MKRAMKVSTGTSSRASVMVSVTAAMAILALVIPAGSALALGDGAPLRLSGEEAQESVEGVLDRFESALDASDPNELREAATGSVGLADSRVDDYIEMGVKAELAGRSGDAAGYFNRAQSLAQVTNELGAGGAALDRVRQARQWQDPQRQAYTEARQWQNKGLEALGADDLEAAIDPYDRAADLYDKIGYNHGVAAVRDIQGQTLDRLNRPVEAAEKLRQSVDLYERLDDVNGWARSSGALGSTYAAMGRVDEATAQFRRASELSGRVNDRVLQAQNLARYGRFMSSTGQHLEAVKALEDSVRLAEMGTNRIDQATNLRYLSESYMEVGQYTDAMNSARSSMSTLQQLDLERMLESSLGSDSMLRRATDVLGIQNSFGLKRSLDSLQREILKRMSQQ
jgi:tetratricopeptide (TPR) repeat protein